VVEWGSVKGVVPIAADVVVSVEVGLGRLMGSGGEGVRMLRFLVLGVGKTCTGLADVSVSVYVECMYG